MKRHRPNPETLGGEQREPFSQTRFTNAPVGGSVRQHAQGHVDSNSGSQFVKHFFEVTHLGTR